MITVGLLLLSLAGLGFLVWAVIRSTDTEFESALDQLRAEMAARLKNDN